MRVPELAVLVLSLVLPILSGRAAPPAPPAQTAPAEAQELSKRAKVAFDAKNFEEAVGLAEQLYALWAIPETLWTLARAHQGLGRQLGDLGKLERARHHLADARTRFEEFARIFEDGLAAERAEIRKLDRADPERASLEVVASRFEEGLKNARVQMEALDLELAALADRSKQPDVEPTEPGPEPGTVIAPSRAPSVSSEVDREDGDTFTVPAIVATGAGVILTGLGIYFLLDAEDTRASVHDAADETGIISSMTQARARALQDQADTRAAVGVASIAVGGAAIITGTILFLIDEPATRQGTTISLRSAGRDATLSIHGTF